MVRPHPEVKGLIQINSSKFKTWPLAFSRDEWEAFLTGVKAGEFDWDTLMEEP